MHQQRASMNVRASAALLCLASVMAPRGSTAGSSTAKDSRGPISMFTRSVPSASASLASTPTTRP